MDYIQNTADDVAAMLRQTGATSIDDLFSPIPSKIRLGRPLNLPAPFSEQELLEHAKALASRNTVFEPGRSFLGAGAYSHFIPPVVDAMAGRGEFVTAYTPYQAEASQGTLQHIFEFQSMICRLAALDVANASHYDGGTALAEAVGMAVHHTERRKVAISGAVHPHARAVVRSICCPAGTEIVEIAPVNGTTPIQALREAASGAACVVIQNPNYFGAIEDMEAVAEVAHAAGALAVASVNPISLALLKPPGECGFDIAVGDAQPLGIEMSFGGPSAGFMAARGEYIRRMPGRIVGETVDAEGQRGFVLTLQTREQHIRREKASSNICSNQALMALRATIYLEALGPHGLRRVAEICVQRAHELAGRLTRIPGVKLAFDAPFFHEFVVELPEARRTLARLKDAGYLGGLAIGDRSALMCCTERHTRQDIEDFAAAVAKFLS